MAGFDEPFVDSLFGGAKVNTHAANIVDTGADHHHHDIGPAVHHAYEEHVDFDQDVFASAMGGDVTSVMPVTHSGAMMMGAVSMGMNMGMGAMDGMTVVGGGLIGNTNVKKEMMVGGDTGMVVGSPVTNESRIMPVIAEDSTEDIGEENQVVEGEEVEVKERKDVGISDDTSSVSGSGSNDHVSHVTVVTKSQKTKGVTKNNRKGKRGGGGGARSGNTRNTARNTNSSALIVPVTKVTHNSHTKRCREKVNQKFKDLVRTLPKPPVDVEVKHKAQILDYAINVFKTLNFKRACLEAQLALCSASSLNDWVTNTVKKANNLQEALQPFFDLICTKGRWKFAEAWFPQSTDASRMSNPTLEFGFGHIPQIMSPDDETGRPNIEMFLEASKSYRFEPKRGVPGRVVCTMRPEWLPRLDNMDTFVRAPIAIQSDVSVCFAVPVVSCGYIAAVGVFYDTKSREYDPGVIELAHSVANTIGNAFGAYKGFPEHKGQISTS